MNSITLWLALALSQFIAFAIIKPSFDKKWKEGFLQGALVVVLTVLIGWVYMSYYERNRMGHVLDQMIKQQTTQEELDKNIFPVKQED